MGQAGEAAYFGSRQSPSNYYMSVDVRHAVSALTIDKN